MNKSQLIDKIAAGADISKAAAGRALDAIIASVELSHRYISDRFLPDKAIDLVDFCR